MMQLPVTIEYSQQRVLTTAQVAQQYQVDTDIIKRNFGNNKSRFVEGKHFYYLTGEILKAFKNEVKNLPIVRKNASTLYLWTEKGMLLHAKSLNNDKAWETYDFLVDSYFRPKTQDSYIIADPIERAKRWIEEQQEKKALQMTISVQAQQIAELQPKASYYDLVLNCADLISTTVIAKDYGQSATWLNELLKQKGIQYNNGEIWLLYQKYAQMGLTSTKTHTYYDYKGQAHTKIHTYWTQKGRLFIYELLKREKILPIIEKLQDVDI